MIDIFLFGVFRVFAVCIYMVGCWLLQTTDVTKVSTDINQCLLSI